jgi:predicted transcriptional regulator of viral defense system
MSMAKMGPYPINAGRRQKRSDLGVELIRVLSSEGLRIFSTEQEREFSSRVGLKDSYLIEALYHLRRNRWIVSLRRGLNAISPSIPGVAPTHEFEIAMALINPAAISHWSALHHHGLTEQVPRKVFVLTAATASIPRRRGNKTPSPNGGYRVGETVYRFIQVRPARFFGTEKVWVGDARVTITDAERTLLDGLSMPQYCGDFAEVLHAFDARGRDLDAERIVDYALRLGDATAKRLGWVLERQGVDPGRLKRLAQVPIKGYRKLDPTGAPKGPVDRKWMIQENLSGKVVT